MTRPGDRAGVPRPGRAVGWRRTCLVPRERSRILDALLDEQARLTRHRTLQRTLFDGGFAGLCFPVEYGGQGLSIEHQKAFNEECDGYEMPVAFNVPTLGVVAATLLECASEEQRRRHIPAILNGDEYWIQFLSEPSGGSDVAGAPHDRRPRRRRMGHQRFQGVEHPGLPVRLRALSGSNELGGAEAPRSHRRHHGDPPARRRDPTDRDAERLPRVLPGVLHRRSGTGDEHRGRRRQGMGRRHPMDVPRTNGGRGRVPVRQR